MPIVLQAAVSVAHPSSMYQTGSKRSSRSSSPESTAGSWSYDQPSSRNSVHSLENATTALDEHFEAAPYTIHNTFIATVDDRITSLDEFYDERQVHSCPPTRAPSADIPDEVIPQRVRVSSKGVFVDKPQNASAPYVVRNTFIETPDDRPSSLEGFFEERQAWSCPPTRQGSLDEECIQPPTRLASVEEERVFSPVLGYIDEHLSSAERFASWEDEVQPQQQLAFGLPREYACEGEKLACQAMCKPWTDEIQPQQQLAFGLPCQQANMPVLRLQDALGMPEVGSKELPSIGSREHATGGCKPCAFFHARTCRSGENCQFCHLCGPEEKKRRQRLKEEQVRAAKLQQTSSDSLFDSILSSLRR